MSNADDITKIIEQLSSDPSKAAAVAKLLAPKPKPSRTESYEVKVVHTLSCKLCGNVYTESYNAPYKQHMAKGKDTSKVDTVNYTHEVETCHDCPGRIETQVLDNSKRQVLIRHILDRIRTLSRGGQ